MSHCHGVCGSKRYFLTASAHTRPGKRPFLIDHSFRFAKSVQPFVDPTSSSPPPPSSSLSSLAIHGLHRHAELLARGLGSTTASSTTTVGHHAAHLLGGPYASHGTRGGFDNLRPGHLLERLGDDLFLHEALLVVLELVVRGHVGQRRASSCTHTLVGLAWFWVVALHPADTLVQEVGELHAGRARERLVVLAYEGRLQAGQRQACTAMGFYKQLDQEQWVASVAGVAIAAVLGQHKLVLFVGSTMMVVVVAVTAVALPVTVGKLVGRGAHEH